MYSRIVIALFSLLVLSGCYSDNEEELAPCRMGIEDVHYSTITAIFTAYGCSGCHVDAAAGGGVSLEHYASVKTVVDNGRLLGAITHAAGYAPMPQGGAKMSDCDISRVKAWIDAGAHEH